jgi:hypothetical protein
MSLGPTQLIVIPFLATTAATQRLKCAIPALSPA